MARGGAAAGKEKASWRVCRFLKQILVLFVDSLQMGQRSITRTSARWVASFSPSLLSHGVLLVIALMAHIWPGCMHYLCGYWQSPLDTNSMLTFWIPLTPVPTVEDGGSPLLFATGSHRDMSFSRTSRLHRHRHALSHCLEGTCMARILMCGLTRLLRVSCHCSCVRRLVGPAERRRRAAGVALQPR